MAVTVDDLIPPELQDAELDPRFVAGIASALERIFSPSTPEEVRPALVEEAREAVLGHIETRRHLREAQAAIDGMTRKLGAAFERLGSAGDRLAKTSEKLQTSVAQLQRRKGVTVH